MSQTPMDAERWRQVDRLYHSALERELGERAAFLAQACQGDEELRRELDELLAQDSSIDNILERPAMDLLADSAVTLTTVTQLGPYSIEAPRAGVRHALRRYPHPSVLRPPSERRRAQISAACPCAGPRNRSHSSRDRPAFQQRGHEGGLEPSGPCSDANRSSSVHSPRGRVDSRWPGFAGVWCADPRSGEIDPRNRTVVQENK